MSEKMSISSFGSFEMGEKFIFLPCISVMVDSFLRNLNEFFGKKLKTLN